MLPEEATVMPTGMGSVNGSLKNFVRPVGFASEIVSLALPPAVIDAGTIVLLTGAGGGVPPITVSDALAGDAPPLKKPASREVVLTTVPVVVDVMVVTIVQPPAGIGDCLNIRITKGSTVAGHVPALTPFVETPGGISS